MMLIIYSVPVWQDMQDMRDCYDSLLSAAAATANSAYGTVFKRLACVFTKKNDGDGNGRYMLV